MFYSVIAALLLGLLGVFPPYLGFLYSGKIIREFKNRGFLKGLAIFAISALGLSIIFNVIPIVCIFFSIYATIIILHFITEKYKVSPWNKAFFGVIISMALIGIIFVLNKDFFMGLKEVFTQQVLTTIGKVDPSIQKEEALKITQSIFNEFLSYAVVFIFLQNILTSYVVNKENSDNWEFSYVFILGFIGAFVAIKFYNVKSIYVQNLMDGIKYIYTIYGIKELYVKIRQKSKLKLISASITMLIYSIQPAILFIYGSLRSFKIFTAKEED